MKSHKLITIIVLIIMCIQHTKVKAYENTDNIIEDQQNNFGISSFIENAQNYTGEFYQDTNIKDIFQEAVKGKINNNNIYEKILKLLGKEVQTAIKNLISILVIIIIHSILKSISENLENENLSKIIYYVQYIAIVTVIMSNFSEIINIVQDAATNLIGFMNSLVPILVSLMLYTGSITTSSILEPIILFMINFIGNFINTILIPSTLIVATLSIVSKIGDKIQIEKLSKFLNNSIIYILGIVLTIFVGVISLEGTLSSSVDGITSKTTKTVVSTAIPVVGKILGDAVDTVLGCGIILKNAVGFIGVLLIIGICITPIIKLTTLTVSYKLISSISEPIADEKITKLLDQIGDIFKVLLAILCSISVMVIIGTTLVIKISNSGMMYR